LSKPCWWEEDKLIEELKKYFLDSTLVYCDDKEITSQATKVLVPKFDVKLRDILRRYK